MRGSFRTVIAVSLLVITFGADAQQPPQKIVGDIVRYDAGSLEVRTAAGVQQTVVMTDHTSISARGASDIKEVQSGRYVGATAAPRSDGTLVASEVHIFPESMRGRGEGHRPMMGSDTMTNATVSNVSRGKAPASSMTNATVATVAGGDEEPKLTLTYKGGEQTIVVPHGTPVMTTEVGNASMLVPKAHVIVYAAPGADGRLVAERISVGKDGYVPPI